MTSNSSCKAISGGPSWPLQHRASSRTVRRPPSSVSLQDPATCPGLPFDLSSSERAWRAVFTALTVRNGSPYPYGGPEREEFLKLFPLDDPVLSVAAAKRLKYHMAYNFAIAMGQEEVPEEPEGMEESPGYLAGGWVERLLKRIRGQGSKGHWSMRRVAYDLLMAKTGCGPVSNAFVEQAMAKHESNLTRPVPTERPACHALVEGNLAVLIEILFGRREFRNRQLVPSLGACVERGCGGGGQLGELLANFLGQAEVGTIYPPVFCGMLEDRGKVWSVYYPDYTQLENDFQNWVDTLWTAELGQRLPVTPIAIREPLKVRVITKGPAAAYYRAVELQKFLHSVLRDHPLFELIGRPVRGPDLQRALGVPSRDEWLLSGDYEAATDNLDPRLISFCWDRICATVQYRGGPLSRTPYYLLGKSALLGHSLTYKGGEKGSGRTVNQTWGQLMGSPVSFPVLNLINAAAAFAGLGWDLRFHSREEISLAPIRVNGDDIAMRIPKVRYSVWKQTVTDCGLKPSLGKNYTARDFVIINSTLFRVTGGLYWTENFVRQSLIDGAIVKGVEAGSRRDIYWTDLGPLSEKILDGLPARHAENVFRVWRQRQRDLFLEIPEGCSYHVAAELGGVGIRPVGSFSLSELDLRRAAWVSSLSPADRLSRVVRAPAIASGPLPDLLREVRSIRERQGRRDVLCLLLEEGKADTHLEVGGIIRGVLNDRENQLSNLVVSRPDTQNGATMRKDHAKVATRLRATWRRNYAEGVTWSGEPMSLDLALNYRSGYTLGVTCLASAPARNFGRLLDDLIPCWRKVTRGDLAVN